MASLTQKTERKRRKKRISGAKARKRKIRAYGSTPPLSIDPKAETKDEKERRNKIMSGR